MELEVIKRAISDQESEIREKFQNERIIDREPENALKYLKHPNILAILGVRRAGKSLYSLLLSKNTPHAYVNFDDPELGGIKANELKKVLEAVIQLKGDVDTIILDEIHNINSWELFATRLREKKRVIITGSNSQMLSGELGTRLTGRHADFTLYPFSFREYLTYHGFQPNIYETEGIAKTKSYFNRYLTEGGFPEVQKFGKYVARRIFEDIIQKDVIVRHNIRLHSSFREVTRLVTSNVGSETSFNKLKNIAGVKSVHTIKNYVGYLENAFLVIKLERYSPKLKEQIISPKKIYLVDTGLTHLNFKVSGDYGKLMENLVAVELMRRKSYNELQTEIYYWKDYQQKEVDFVIKEGPEIKQLIQVCYDLGNYNTRERETKSLLKASRELKCRNLLILTEDDEGEEKLDRKTIKYKPLWKWLIQKETQKHGQNS